MFLSSAAVAVMILTSTPERESLPSAFALIVGSRSGGPGQNPLRYAGTDAARFAELLIELGRYAKDHVRVLQDPSREQLLNEFRILEVQLRERQRQGQNTSLLFYYSGHARASGLSLGSEELPLGDLRDQLVSLPADLTIAVLDACQSGAISRVKGAESAPDFSINSVSQLNTRGLAVMASSTGSELSQESDRLAGSYFTHHLLMGMRGAGDVDGDGRVTLTEAYRYAYARTLLETAATSVGSQHATLETNLQGKGEVPLTYPKEASASLTLAPELRGSILVSTGESIVGELHKVAGNPIRLGLPPGHYTVMVRQSDVRYECIAELVEGRETPLALASCVATSLTPGSQKGDLVGTVFESASSPQQPGWHFEAQLGLPLSYYPSHVGNGGFYAAASVTATYYFEKLIDDRSHALGLLSFLQHPNSISIAPDFSWSSRAGVSSDFGGGLSVALYPWRRTGFVASASGHVQGESSSLGITLGIHQYFSSTLRLELLYYGARVRGVFTPAQCDGLPCPVTQYRSDSDSGGLGMTTLWAGERLSTHFSVSVGRNRGLSSGSTSFSTSDDAEYFLNRRVSVGLGGLLLFVRSAPFSQTLYSVGPFLHAFVSENLLVSAKYSASGNSINSYTVGHGLDLGVAWRF